MMPPMSAISATDILTQALDHALAQGEGPVSPIAIINATGDEALEAEKISNNACNKLSNTLNGVFNTLLVRATRQKEETLGLVALAAAHAAPGAKIYVAQENAHGAGSLEKTLRRAFPDAQAVIKFKCRVLVLDAGAGAAAVLKKWADDAAIRKVKHNRGEFWSAPGVFSWDRPDPGSLMLLAHLPKSMPGNAADLGCGNGLLSGNVIKKDGVTGLWALDADARSVECCRRNLEDRGSAVPFHVLWRDATGDLSDLPDMDFVVMNPPFHDQQHESRELGRKFVEAALKLLKSGGELYLVANRHLPYEDILSKEASKVSVLEDANGFKIIKAIR